MSRQEPTTSTTLGNTRYSETPVTASQNTVRRSRRGGGAATASSSVVSVRRSIARSTRSPSAVAMAAHGRGGRAGAHHANRMTRVGAPARIERPVSLPAPGAGGGIGAVTSTFAGRVAAVRGQAMERLARVPGVLAAIDRDRRHGGGLLAGALAYRLFGALLPLSLLAAVALGYAATVDESAPGSAGRALGLREALASSLAQSSKLSAGTRWVVAASAAFALVFAATGAARAIRAIHTLAWEGGVRRLGRALPAGVVLVVAVVAFVAVWGLVGSARAHLGAFGIVAAVVAVIPFFAIWLGVSWLLPHADAPWTALIPGAALFAVGMEVIHLGTVLFISGRLERASATYGAFGAAFTVLLWLYLGSRVIVGSAMLNATLWRRSQ